MASYTTTLVSPVTRDWNIVGFGRRAGSPNTTFTLANSDAANPLKVDVTVKGRIVDLEVPLGSGINYTDVLNCSINELGNPISFEMVKMSTQATHTFYQFSLHFANDAPPAPRGRRKKVAATEEVTATLTA